MIFLNKKILDLDYKSDKLNKIMILKYYITYKIIKLIES